ncbi:hypothetical protein CCR97_01705 [Rhodoplanes elegans]|uniref:Uncharacterized protein n=1 Tax=Rhodoplanes elegans TaxID=29408 RepID=A0A327KM89_9BRAD|nr:DUF6640 family protein [Rhodoplanes elegans]MBK5956934.1 hypothetical protein [Rhodoplanes elegans]RAI39919.1 hypothetical protein CH338_07915 [Rhodoplanes elegans]
MLLAPRLLISVVALTTLSGNIADWNATHIFSELWSPQARFHGAWFVIAMTLLSVVSLWLVWSGRRPIERAGLAILIQGAIWIAFFPAMLVPDTLLADPGKEVRPAGIDLNLLGAVANVILLATAWALLRRAGSAVRPA